MYGGNPFSPKRRSKSNSYTPDTTLDLLRAASRKLKRVEKQQRRNCNLAQTPPKMFYCDPGQQHAEPFLIPSELDTDRYMSSDSAESPTKNGNHLSSQSSPERSNAAGETFHLHSRTDYRTDYHITHNKGNRSPTTSISTVAHDSPHRSTTLFNSSPLQSSTNNNASLTPGTASHHHPHPHPHSHSHPHPHPHRHRHSRRVPLETSKFKAAHLGHVHGWNARLSAIAAAYGQRSGNSQYASRDAEPERTRP